MSVTPIEVVRRFPQYGYKPRKEREIVETLPNKDDGSLIHQLFAPDPETGIPRSDLAIVMSRDASPEVSQYIRDTLMRPISNDSNVGEDADFALSSVKSSYESTVDYMNRIYELCQASEPSNSSQSE